MALDLVTEDTTAAAAGTASFHALVQRLSEQSVRKHFDAYEDVPWDEPGYGMDAADPRWELREDDPLGGTSWYRSQPQEVRAAIGLHSVVSKMKVGLEFENVLARGLLEYIATLPNGSPEYRYAHHEIIEEGQHQLMFQEFVNRSGLDPAGMPAKAKFGARRVITMGRTFPELFFMFVLGGEDPIDHVQREALRRGGSHPLLERIMRIHVTEEARHLSFARSLLKERVGRMSRRQKLRMGIATPLLLGEMGAMMLKPSSELVRRFGIPREVMREAYDDNPAYKEGAAVALRKVRRLAHELGLITPLTKPIWKARRIWLDDVA